jgi:hypothetical protein
LAQSKCIHRKNVAVVAYLLSPVWMRPPFSSHMLKRMTPLLAVVPLLAQAPPSPRPGPKADTVERRIEEIRLRLERNRAGTPLNRELASFTERYLDEAQDALNSGRQFQAQRLADAADACRRPIDHLERLADKRRGLPGPPPRPGAPDLTDRLQLVFFRLRLSDFFLKQIPPPRPKRLVDLARRFYEQAVQAQQEGNLAAADELTKAADDLTHALESLAQAALPQGQP